MAALQDSIWRGTGVALLLCMLSACGGASPTDAESPERDALSAELEQKATELEAEFARLQGTRQPSAPAEGADGDSPDDHVTLDKEKTVDAPEAAPGAAAVETAEPSEERPEVSRRERCKTACRALSSMQRSAAGICSLVGEGHEKCVWARKQVRDARSQVHRAGCSCD